MEMNHRDLVGLSSETLNATIPSVVLYNTPTSQMQHCGEYCWRCCEILSYPLHSKVSLSSVEYVRARVLQPCIAQLTGLRAELCRVGPSCFPITTAHSLTSLPRHDARLKQGIFAHTTAWRHNTISPLNKFLFSASVGSRNPHPVLD